MKIMKKTAKQFAFGVVNFSQASRDCHQNFISLYRMFASSKVIILPDVLKIYFTVLRHLIVIIHGLINFSLHKSYLYNYYQLPVLKVKINYMRRKMYINLEILLLQYFIVVYQSTKLN